MGTDEDFDIDAGWETPEPAPTHAAPPRPARIESLAPPSGDTDDLDAAWDDATESTSPPIGGPARPSRPRRPRGAAKAAPDKAPVELPAHPAPPIKKARRQLERERRAHAKRRQQERKAERRALHEAERRERAEQQRAEAQARKPAPQRQRDRPQKKRQPDKRTAAPSPEPQRGRPAGKRRPERTETRPRPAPPKRRASAKASRGKSRHRAKQKRRQSAQTTYVIGAALLVFVIALVWFLVSRH